MRRCDTIFLFLLARSHAITLADPEGEGGGGGGRVSGPP